MHVDFGLKYVYTCTKLENIPSNLKFTSLLYMHSKFIDWMMGVSNIELECHLWSMFDLGCVPKLATRDS